MNAGCSVLFHLLFWNKFVNFLIFIWEIDCFSVIKKIVGSKNETHRVWDFCLIFYSTLSQWRAIIYCSSKTNYILLKKIFLNFWTTTHWCCLCHFKNFGQVRWNCLWIWRYQKRNKIKNTKWIGLKTLFSS